MKPLPFTNYKNSRRLSRIIAAQSRTSFNISKCATQGKSTQDFYANFIKFQTGDMLIEALIGLVLMAIIAVGVTTITSKVEKGKREMSVQDLAVSQLQELLVKNGNGTVDLCDTTLETITLPDETITIQPPTSCALASTTVNGVAFTGLKQPIVLSVFSAKLNATFTVGGVSAQQ
ncbi:MAG TPA: hypothetical protein VIZ65_13880 [Cellvibrionaceae bacterium]